jgi:hypothetical protein
LDSADKLVVNNQNIHNKKLTSGGFHKSSRTTFSKPFEPLKTKDDFEKICQPSEMVSKKITSTPVRKQKTRFMISKQPLTTLTTLKGGVNKQSSTRSKRNSVVSMVHKFMPTSSALFTPVRKSSRERSMSGVKNINRKGDQSRPISKETGKAWSQQITPKREQTKSVFAFISESNNDKINHKTKLKGNLCDFKDNKAPKPADYFEKQGFMEGKTERIIE